MIDNLFTIFLRLWYLYLEAFGNCVYNKLYNPLTAKAPENSWANGTERRFKLSFEML